MGIFCRIYIQVIGDIDQRIQAGQVSGAEGRRFRPPHSWPQDSIDLADTIAFAQRIPKRRHKPVGADTVGNEVWGILAKDNSLAKHFRGKLLHKLQQSWISVNIGHNFQQAHVAHRVEEVCNQEVLAEILAAPFGEHMCR